MKVCLFGAYDPDYIRNLVIRKGLESQGFEVVQCQVSPRLNRREQYAALWREWHKLRDDPIVLLVAKSNQAVMPLAWWLSRTKQISIVFDPFISLYDTIVSDRQLIFPGSLKAHLYYWLDRISMHLADAVLADTREHQRYFAVAFNIPKQHIFVVPVGTDESLYFPRPHQSADAPVLLFWGRFIPLHGVEYILGAAKLLEESMNVQLKLVGSGQTFNDMVALARQLSLTRTSFSGSVELEQLPILMSQADICLGVFGKSDKAKRVIPNKVYAALAMRKPVITGDSPAIRSHFEHRRHLYTVPMADPQALAEGITELVRDAQLCSRMAQEGYELFRAEYTTQRIGERLRAVLETVVSR
jgi:glycosyltransferase involved in cell wall biosynthesis